MKRFLQIFTLEILIAVFFTLSIASQKQKDSSSQRLDPRLQHLLNAKQSNTMSIESAAQGVNTALNAQGETVYPCFVYADNLGQIRSSGVQLQSIVRNFATARLTIAELEQLSVNPSVTYIAPSALEFLHNDIACGYIGADVLHSGYINSTQYTGTGVIVGIIDTGIDWEHLDFCESSDTTKSRILYLWDQTITPTGDEISPTGYGYGVEYTQVQINDELDGSPVGFVREADTHGHGTHVAGTAAGNGNSLSTKKYKGIAPEAELIIVKAGNGTFLSTNIVDAISYLNAKATAEGKPLVINMSLGSDAGPHDGTDTKGLAVMNFASPGRIAVMSAGNSGNTPIHFSGAINNGDSIDVTFTVPVYTAASGASNDAFAFDVWLQDNASVNAKIISPNLYSAEQNIETAAYTYTDDGTIYLYNYIYTDNGDREIFGQISDTDPAKTPVAGIWTLRLINNSGSSTLYHGWLYDYLVGSNLKTVTVAGGNSNYTVSNASDSAIIVGAFASRWRWVVSDGTAYWLGSPNGSDTIALFSSIGPSRTGTTKPDITAPGQKVISSRSSDAVFGVGDIVPGNKHVLMQGTSMSSPVVTGSVALLLQQNGNLTPAEVKSLFAATATVDGYTGSVPNNIWGSGKLNIASAIAREINPLFSVQRNILSYDEWGSDVSSSNLLNRKIAVKFSPTSSANIVGAFFHPTSIATLTGSLRAEIWSDSVSGLPGSKLGSTVSFNQNALLPSSWNYIDMTTANVPMSSGSNYHLVLLCDSVTDFRLYYDNGNNDHRSSYNSGAGWASFTSGDYRLRPVLMTDVSTLPVELIAFTASFNNNNVLLEWSTATEVNNHGFEIERRGVNSQTWNTIGFVEGSGNSNSPKTYSYNDAGAKGRVTYRLKQIDNGGKFSYSNEVEVNIGSSPKQFALAQNYPNPFNPTTQISYQLPASGFVSLKVYDMLGKEVTTLVSEVQEAGAQQLTFSANTYPSGLYFYTLRSGSYVETKKMLLIK